MANRKERLVRASRKLWPTRGVNQDSDLNNETPFLLVLFLFVLFLSLLLPLLMVVVEAVVVVVIVAVVVVVVVVVLLVLLVPGHLLLRYAVRGPRHPRARRHG